MKINLWKDKLSDIKQKYTVDEWLVIGVVLSIFISLYVTCGVLVGAFIYLVKTGKLKNAIVRVSGSLYIMAFCGLSILVSSYYLNWHGILIGIGMSLIFGFGMYVRTVMTKPLLETILKICCIASIFCCGVAIAQQLVMAHDASYRASSTFYNANYYATIIEFVVIFCSYKLMQEHTKKQRLLYIATILVNVLGLYLCDCRTVWAAIIAGIVMMLFFARKYKAILIAIGASCVFVIALSFLPSLFPRIDSIESSFEVRESIWITALKGIVANPIFGQGGATYGQIYSFYGGHPTFHAHNLFLDPLLNFGIVGTSLLIVYLVRNCYPILKMYTKKTDPQLFSMLVGILCCVLVHGMMDTTVFWIQTGLLFMILLGSAGIYGNQQVVYDAEHYRSKVGAHAYSSLNHSRAGHQSRSTMLSEAAAPISPSGKLYKNNRAGKWAAEDMGKKGREPRGWIR